MPNTGNTQQIINYGATANDGTGDPLRTAFIKTDENFDNVWLAGPVGSNITISNNTIQTNNTNGNIILKPNGTGIIQANASIIPNSTGTRDLGSSAQSWRRAYVDELLPETLTVSGDAVIGGNLTIEGDTIQIGNITTDTLTIQLANTAGNKTAANGAGITVGANDAIATFLFNSTSNTWVTNIGANIGGNATASYFIGNGSLLTGISTSATGNSLINGNSNVVVINNGNVSISANGYANILTVVNANLGWNSNQLEQVIIDAPLRSTTGIRSPSIDARSNIYSLINDGTIRSGSLQVNAVGNGNGEITAVTANFSGNISAGNLNANNATLTQNLSANTGAFTGNVSAGNLYVANNATVVSDLYVKTGTFYGDSQGHDAIYAGVPLFTDLGTGVIAQFSGNTDTYTQFNFQNGNAGPLASGDYVITADNGNDTAHFLNIGLTGSGWNGTQPNSLGANIGPNDGYFYVQDGNLAIGVKDGGTAYVWKYANTGNFTLPNNGSIIVDGGDGVIGPVSDDMVISWDNEELILRSINGSIEAQADADFRVKTGYDVGSGDYLYKWLFTNNDELVNITGDSTILTEAGNLNLQGGRNTLSSGNVQITAVDNGVAVNVWTFDNTGVLTVPGNITGADVVIANTFVSNAFNVVTAGNLSITSQYGLGFTGTILEDNGTLELIGSGGGGVVVGWDSTYGNGLGNIATVNFNEVGGEGILLRTGNRAATEYNWNFDSTGNLTLPGNITGNTGGFAIGYRDIPQVSFTGNATIATADAGKHFYSTQSTNYVLTIANNASQGFQTGAAITVINQGTGNITLAQGSGVTLYLTGNATSGNRTVTTFGMATLIKVATDTWFVSGAGVI